MRMDNQRKILKMTVFLFFLFFATTSFATEAIAGYKQKIVIFDEHITWPEVEVAVAEWKKAYEVSVVMELPLINAVVLNVPPNISSKELEADPRVASIEYDKEVKVGDVKNSQSKSFIEPTGEPDPEYNTWGLLKLYDEPYEDIMDWISEDDIPKKVWWAVHKAEECKVRIGILDTGIDYNRKELNKIIKDGIDIANLSFEQDQNEQQVVEELPSDDNGHGTFITGILTTMMDKDLQRGKNVAIEIYSIKVLDHKASGELSNVVMGLQWAIDHNMDIVNMSLGYKKNSLALRLAIQAAHKAGLIMIGASGNHSNYDDDFFLKGLADGGAADGGAADGGAADGGAADGGAADGGAADGGAADGGAADGGAADGGAADGGAADGGAADTDIESIYAYPTMYPARYPEVISVAASTPFGQLSSFSNYDEKTDLMAPGADILSIDITNGDMADGYGYCSGTSMAVPFVVAAAAMMKGFDPDIGPEEVKNILMETAEYNDSSQVGELDLTAALQNLSDRLYEEANGSSRLAYQQYLEKLEKRKERFTELQQKMRNTGTLPWYKKRDSYAVNTQSTDWNTDWSTDWNTDWSTDWNTDWSNDWNTDWSNDWGTDWNNYWGTDWNNYWSNN